MRNLILYCMSVYAITYVIADSDIFEPVRDRILIDKIEGRVRSQWLVKLFKCYLCLGFWVGLLLYSVLALLSAPGFELNSMSFFIVLTGAASSRVLDALTYLRND